MYIIAVSDQDVSDSAKTIVAKSNERQAAESNTGPIYELATDRGADYELLSTAKNNNDGSKDEANPTYDFATDRGADYDMIDRAAVKRDINGYIDVDEDAESEPEEGAVDSGFLYMSHEDEEFA